jgi:hypothetical protein
LKAWIAAAVVVTATVAFALSGGNASAHTQPVNNNCMAETGVAPNNLHDAVTPTFTNVTDTSVTVNWTDNCTNEEGFRVFRDGANVSGDLSSNTVSYADAGLTCGTTYTYYVQAFHSEQGTSNSLAANVTTAACGPPPPASCPTGNHGQYVSCVARNESSPPGKGPVVSEAAQSDEGKPNP